MRFVFWTFLLTVLVQAQTPCKTCHTCEYPTVSRPCLVDCPREDFISIRNSATAAPKTILLDYIKERYGAMTFRHGTHAEMADMIGGCSACHHYNTTGPVLQCRHCHAEGENREDLSVPGLKAALHRQCISCHREWNPSTKCGSCHSKTSVGNKDYNHTTASRPAKTFYATPSMEDTFVTFHHDEHVDRFGFSCSTCHAEKSCVACHRKSGIEKVKTVDRHSACFNCHEEKPCSRCHASTELPEFDHTKRTGWPLRRYHQSLSCNLCHGSEKQFKRVRSDCVSCHRLQDRNSFRHAVTGLQLDENHNGLSCSDCHVGNVFSQTPLCSDCHDDKTWPNNRPGKWLP